MPRNVPEQELILIENLIAQRSEGLSVGELLANPRVALPKRTAQRRLEQLIEEQRIKPVGDGRGRRYVSSRPTPLNPTETPRLNEPRPEEAWLSPEGAAIAEHVCQPKSRRKPVGYRATFLEDYRPNETAYLSPAIRARLAAAGKVGLTDLPAGTYLRHIMSRLIIDLSWNSSRLEGNTYSLLETRRLLELGEMAEGKAAREAQMILNHKAAIEMLADQADGIGFNRYTVFSLHALLSDNLLSDARMCGSLRFRAVGIGGSVFYPLEGPERIERYFFEMLEKAEAIDDPFEQAFFVMVQLPYMQPFEDVNKRTSRLAANIPLVRQNLCPLSFVDVEQSDYVNGLLGVYELNRVELLRDVFVAAYLKSCERYEAVRYSLGDPDPFRLRHRALIGECVREAVLDRWPRSDIPDRLREWAGARVIETDRKRFAEVVAHELSALHEGNIARFRVRPSEFAAWAAESRA
ncbi:MAG: Fic family protein [Verrucomicrobiae bacterium]|nr:Fic family protein [Verrucomicrobiae bacterium]MCP5551428.1 Fic family protein [Akkermansiaceae bacterium]